MAKVSIIGCGPGKRSLITGEAIDAIYRSDILYGTKRVLDHFEDFHGTRIEIRGNYENIIDDIQRNYKKAKLSVLVTGDGGFHSFGSLVAKKIGKKNCVYYSGISSMQYAFNQLAINWEDAIFLSNHGKEIFNKEKIIKENDKIGILSSGEKGVRELLQDLPKSLFGDKRIFVLENLSYEDEHIHEITYEEGLSASFADLSIIIIISRGIDG